MHRRSIEFERLSRTVASLSATRCSTSPPVRDRLPASSTCFTMASTRAYWTRTCWQSSSRWRVTSNPQQLDDLAPRSRWLAGAFLQNIAWQAVGQVPRFQCVALQHTPRDGVPASLTGLA